LASSELIPISVIVGEIELFIDPVPAVGVGVIALEMISKE